MAENRHIPENYWDILSYTIHIWDYTEPTISFNNNGGGVTGFSPI